MLSKQTCNISNLNMVCRAKDIEVEKFGFGKKAFSRSTHSDGLMVTKYSQSTSSAMGL